ncbi:MAG: autotransporter-associated beta strand repeat-containing protein [Pirellulales bacterium]
MNYIRYDEATGTREIDRTSLQGNSYSINSEHASFGSDTSNSTGALYVVGERGDGHRLRALLSYDNGQTWQDYAQSDYHGEIAHPSLARSVTPEGKVIGGVALDDPYWGWVHYLELPTVQPTTTSAYWDGDNNREWSNAQNYVGNVKPTFDNGLALTIGAGNSPANADPMVIVSNRTVRALVFGVAADTAVNIRLKNNASNTARTLTFESAVSGGSAEINVHHDAAGNIDIGGGSGLGHVELNDVLRVNHNGNGFLTISRPISGSHTITKYGDGEFELTGNNPGFSGDLNIQEGKLALKGSGSEDGQPDVHVASGGTLSLGSGFVGKTATIGNLTGAGRVDPQYNSGSGTRTLQVNQTSDGTFSGVLRDASSGGRVLALKKTGAGQLTLSGSNAYTGTTSVNTGTLLVNGDQAAAPGAVTVAGGATLGGSGTIGGAVAVQSAGTLSPGNRVGTLALNSDLTLNGGAQLKFEIGTTNADLATVAGGLELADGWVLKIVDAGNDSGAPGRYELFTYGSLDSLSQPTYNLDDIGDLGWTADMLTVIDGGDGSVYLRVIARPTLAVDMDVFAGGRLNVSGPASQSLGIRSVGPQTNPPTIRIAIRLAPGSQTGWLRFGDAGGRTDVFADGVEAEWHAAAEWAGKRVRGLQPATSYTFHAKAAPADLSAETALVEVGTHATNKDCDVNRSSLVTALDCAHIRAATLRGGTLGDTIPWACDVNGDGAVDASDLDAIDSALLAPSSP